MIRVSALVGLFSLLTTACGLGPFAGEGGGNDNLPVAGIGPYGKLEPDRDTPVDEPIVLADPGANLLEPSLVEGDDGGFDIYVERRGTDLPGEIWRASINTLTEPPDEPLTLFYAASTPWEAGDVRAPSAVRTGEGDLVIAYEAGPADDPSLGILVVSPSGVVARDAPIIRGARSPGLAFHDGSYTLFFEDATRPGIFVATATDNFDFEVRDEPVVSPGIGAEDFDRGRVRRPSSLVRTTAAGRVRIDVFYEGHTLPATTEEDEVAIGYVGGFALSELVRPAPLGEPVLPPGIPGEQAPSVLIEASRAIMLYVDSRALRARIGAATHP